MATVEDLFPLLDAFLGDNRSITPDVKVGILNAARIEFWRLIVTARGAEYWFGATSQHGDSGAENYFPVFQPGQTQYNLPPDFHTLLSVRVTTEPYRALDFTPVQLGSDSEFSLHTSPSVVWGDRVPYTILGGAPGQLTFFNEPPAVLEPVLHYIRTSTAWPNADSSIDEFPASCHDLICEWAAQRIVLGINDRRYPAYAAQWRTRVLGWLNTARREMTSRPVVRGFLEWD